MRRKAGKGERGDVERGRREVRRVVAVRLLQEKENGQLTRTRLRSSRMRTFNVTRFSDTEGISYLPKSTFSGAMGQTPDESKLKKAREEVGREQPTL